MCTLCAACKLNTVTACLGSMILQHLLQVIDEWSGKGFRLLALARGPIGGISRQSLGLLALEQLEAQADTFDLLGLLVLSNQLREDSIHTVDMLQHQ